MPSPPCPRPAGPRERTLRIAARQCGGPRNECEQCPSHTGILWPLHLRPLAMAASLALEPVRTPSSNISVTSCPRPVFRKARPSEVSGTSFYRLHNGFLERIVEAGTVRLVPAFSPVPSADDDPRTDIASSNRGLVHG